ncbi:Calx-beta domain-containing protein [uncultured Erythrobacter sp.]|uniref:Calx-beta domain-containing protein n=1 Tax=uncultured Erythrobacter sp. TaxID=263913 RepID=UPI0026181CF3|nr:Calx-beta domain-containing protein [uncultured Erythrobacter sp.]
MVAGTTSSVFINEIHYDNNSPTSDANEYVEIANPLGVDLTGWTVVFYNGSNGTSYNTLNLSGTGTIQGFPLPANGLQNGAPDGIALVDAMGNVVQFLSYEGSLTATDGPANGQTSTDIGVGEGPASASGTTTDTQSLQLQGTGNTAGDFMWVENIAQTQSAVNTGQTFTLPIVTVLDEGFETDGSVDTGSGVRYTFSSGQGNDGFSDFFTRTDGSDVDPSYAVTGQTGSFFFAAQDTDSVPGLSTDDEQSIFFTGLDITGLTNLMFSIDVAEDDSSDGNEDWDSTDFFQVFVTIDGGTSFQIFGIENDGVGTGSGSNGAPLLDTDLDGTGDGTQISANFATFAAAIAGSGSTLDIELRFHLDSGDEDLAIDQVTVTGEQGGTLPPPVVFINEINYALAGPDELFEFVEVVGEAGLEATGYIIVYYDGDTGAEYARSTLGLTPFTDQGDGFGTKSVGFPFDFLQDGAPDGIALVNPDGDVLQFLSYEGAFTAADGPAAGMMSTDIGVAETDPATPNQSLQLTGTGEGPDDFTWVTGTASQGAFNDGQSFGPPPEPGTLSIADAGVTEGDSGTTDLTFTVTRTGGTDGTVTVDFTTSLIPSQADASDFVANSGTLTFLDGETSQTITVQVNGDTDFEPTELFAVDLSNPTGGATIDDGSALGTIFADDANTTPQGPAEVFINEIHYDNSGADVGEGIEIAGPAGTDLSGWQLALYNGNGGVVYDTENLTGIIPDQDDGFGTLAFPISGIQNGPDAIALVDPSGNVVQFLSYEGTFEATNGPALGLTSEDIGVAEGGVPAGTSLQLGGTGNVADDFTWQASQTDNFGLVNTGQDFTPVNPNGALFIDDASVAEGDSGTAQITFNVFRVGGDTGAVSADFAVILGSEFSDADAADLSGATTGTVSFADGETFQTITIDVVGDTVGEPSEFFDVVLSNPTGGASIGAGTGVGTIVNDDPLNLEIGEIQSAGHTSLFVGNEVTTTGVVTAVASNGFYMQDPDGDGDSATSDGIFVFTGIAPTVVAGDGLTVVGTVSEFQGGGDPANLTITQLTDAAITVDSTGNALPDAIVIGPNGITPPTEVIEDDDFTSFDPLTDGIDFWESLEGMLVTIENPVSVDSTNGFGELWTVASDGAGNLSATNVSDEGLVVIEGGDGGLGEFDAGAGSDFNPERVQIDSAGPLNGVDVAIPDVTPGTLLNTVTGVVDYGFENYQVRPTTDVTVAQASTNIAETTALVPGAVNQLSLATYNVLNFDINEADGDTDIAEGRLAGIATDIGINLAAPDIVVLQEVQDDSGSATDGTVSAQMTLEALATEIFNQTGIQYSVFDNPFVVDGETGGQPGGNIRIAFLYRDDRVDLDEASAFTITDDTGAIDAAFANSRAPLGANFTFNGQTVTVIGNHFTSKIGSDSSFSAIQPPTNAGAVARAAQAAAVNAHIDELLAANPDAKIAVAGDFNEFQFEEPMEVLTGELDFDGATVSPGSETVLENLTFKLDEDDRFSVLFQGNAQALDHILATSNLADGAQIDAVHTNTPLGNPNSDHDPFLAVFNVGVQDIVGTNQFDDTLDGNDGEDDIDGLRGDDTINGNGGDDNIDGGRGEDTIDGGDGDDMIDAGADNDDVMGGAGDDMIDGGDGDDMLDGGDDNDKINGDRGNDMIMGGDGDDMLDGGLGDDILFGGEGNDMLIGGSQRDMLFGEGGDDNLDGGAREDELDGGTGMDTLTGGTQSDLFILHADQTAADADTITDFERNIDGIRIDGSMGRTITFVQAGPDVQILSDGVLVATVLNAAEADVQAASLIDGGGLTLQGTRGPDTLTGGAMDDIIFGDRGNDIIDGMGGDDTIDAGPGDDNVMGGAGEDTILGGDGADMISGGDNDDTITGDRGNDILSGDGGDDMITGGIGLDMLSGGAGMDMLSGGDQADLLDGGADNDTLDGGRSTDTLDGGTGMDMLTGGTQADLFILHADQTAADADTITDFERNLDTIRIDGAGGKAITFTQVGLDTEIAADGVLVATVLNATSADVLAQTSFDAPPASAMSQAAPSAVAQSIGSVAVMLSDVNDAAFVFNDAASAPVTTTGYSHTKVPLSDMFGAVPEPATGKFALDGIEAEDNPWIEHGSFGFEPIA